MSRGRVTLTTMSKVLLYLAWSGFLVSLVAPATREPFMFFPARHMPVAVMLAVSALSAFAPLETNGNAILIFAANVCFLASPVVVNAPRRTFRRALSLPVLAGALLAWWPLAASTARSSHDQRRFRARLNSMRQGLRLRESDHVFDCEVTRAVAFGFRGNRLAPLGFCNRASRIISWRSGSCSAQGQGVEVCGCCHGGERAPCAGRARKRPSRLGLGVHPLANSWNGWCVHVVEHDGRVEARREDERSQKLSFFS